MAYLDPVTNFGVVTVSGYYDELATTITLNGGEGALLPSSGAFNLVWWNNTDCIEPSTDNNKEIVRVTNRTGDVLTVLRAQEGTYATIKNIAGKKYKMVLSITQKTIEDIDEKLVNISGTNTGDQVGDGITITGSGTIADPFKSVEVNKPAGTNTMIQFNDNDVMGASADLTFNKTTKVLAIQSRDVMSYMRVYTIALS